MVLTNREEELMDFLWEQNKPLAANEILAECKERSWSDRYLQVMLRSLEKKGAIESCGTVRQGNHYSRQFHCRLTKEEYFAQLAQAFDQAQRGGGFPFSQASGVNSRLFARAVVSLAAKASPKEQEEVIRELEQLLEEYRQKE